MTSKVKLFLILLGVFLVITPSCRYESSVIFPDGEIALVNNPGAKDVPLDRVIKFLSRLEDYMYLPKDIHDMAEASGIRCAIVWDGEFPLVLFNTTDFGKIYVDPTEWLI